MTARRLILFDLDDTLSDRAGAFRNWARKWIARHGIGDPDALDWMCTNDDGGYRPRDLFFADAKERFALAQRASELARDYALTAHDDYHEDPVIVGELRSLVDRGARVGLVTNGAVGQQVKAEKLGIMPLLSCCVVSGLVGIRKPDPRIFALAVEAAGGPGPDVAWMVGDNADYVVVKNHSFTAQFAIYEKSKTRARLLNELGGREIEMPKLNDWLVVGLNQAGCTITAALKHPQFPIMDRQRLKNWQRKFNEQVESARDLLLPTRPRAAREKEPSRER